MGNGLKAALRGSKVPWSVEFTWRGALRAAMECPVLGRAVPIPKGREISAAAPSSHLRLNPAGMGRPCWKKPSEFGNQEKSHSRLFSVCSTPLQPLPTLSAALYFPIRSIRDPRPFCIFPLWFLLLLDQDLGAQAGYKKQFKPVRFFIHVTKLFRAGRGRGGNAQNKRN